MLKKFFAFLAVGLAVLLVLCWIYLPSITRYRELKSEEERLIQKIREIDGKIKALADERHLLQTDVAYLEKVIREELGFVKPGEIVYELVTKKQPESVPEDSSGKVVTPDKTSTSAFKEVVPEANIVSARTVAESLVRTAPKVSKKKTSSTNRSN